MLCLFNCIHFSSTFSRHWYLQNCLSASHVKPMISQANNIEKQYVMDSLECDIPSTQSRCC